MRTIAAALLVLGLGAANAQDKKPEPPQTPAKTLKVGDPPPALLATKWLQGTEVKSFEKDKVYVVDFWTIYCGYCIKLMPHMSELQKEYRDKGVTFIGFTAQDTRGNSQQKVTDFVERRGPKLGYTFAFADNSETYNAWMNAANQNDIPCCFVIGKDGTIAYIGHPMYLDEVLPKVVAGKWTPEDAKTMQKTTEDVNAVFTALRNPDADEGLKVIADFQKAHPKLAGIPYFISPHLSLLIKAKKLAEARQYAEELIAKATKHDDPSTLSMVSVAMRLPGVNGDKEMLALSLQAALAGLKISGDKDPLALLTVAQSYFALGDKDKARDYGGKAVAATMGETEPFKNYVKGEVKKFGEDK